MNTAQEIQRRLIADWKFKPNGDWLSGGKCPQCGKFEAYTRAEKPWYLSCSRQNKCGASTAVKTLYPALFEQYNKRYKATRTNPTATADAYMNIERGLDTTKIKGWYTQGRYKNPNANKETATVRFALADGVYMERFIEAVTITDPETAQKDERKQNFKGKWGGLAWCPPNLKPDAFGESWVNDGDEIWIVEGIIDAISLNINGYKAIASLSAQHYPQKTLAELKGKKVKLIWALDSDAAGKKWMQRHAKRAADEGFSVCAAYIPTKKDIKDWNELQVREQISEETIAECRYHGQLLLAKSAKEKARLIFDRKGSRFFCVEYNRRTYGVTVSSAEEDNDKAFDKMSLIPIANFSIHFQYFMRNEVTDESWYVAKTAFPHKGQEVQCRFSGAQISSAAEFKKRVISVAPGAVFSGRSSHLDWLCQTHLFGIKTIETIDFIGYSKKHDIYVFDKYAFKEGRQYSLNQQEYFDVGKTSITSLQKSINLKIADARDYKPEWTENFFTAFGEKGIVALTFWMGSLFAEQIRAKQSSFPFLEIVGEAGSGKTSLIEFLWKLYGRGDEEGFDPAKATAAGISRKFTQLSNLPIVLIEADREVDTVKSKKFDWEETKPLYNGRGTRTRGVKNSGNETYDPPFRASLVVAQNEAVNASPAVMQRFVLTEFTRENHSIESKKAADTLNLTSVESVSHFIAKILLNQQNVLDTFFRQFEKYEHYLLQNPDIKNRRIAKNHAQILALTEALFTLIDISKDRQILVRGHIQDMAIKRERAIGGDHPVVENFWEVFEYLHTEKEGGLNHSAKAAYIAVNLIEFERFAKAHYLAIPSLDEIKKHLKSGSRTRELLNISKSTTSAISKKSVRCWVFRDLEHYPLHAKS